MGIKSLLGFGQARDKPVRNYSNGEYSFNFGRSTCGKSVNEMTAMQTTAVYACVRILSEAIASLMKQVVTTMQYVFAGVGGFMGWFLGELDGFLYALLMFVVIDYATGLMAAFVQKKISSEVGFKGICRKVLIFLLVGIANILDLNVIGTGSVLRTAVIFFYISNEGVSLLENASHLGLPVPQKIKAVLEQLHDRAEDDETGEE